MKSLKYVLILGMLTAFVTMSATCGGDTVGNGSEQINLQKTTILSRKTN